MARLIFKTLLITVGAAFALTACNNSVKQYRRENFNPNKPDLNNVLGTTESDIEKMRSKADKDADEEKSESNLSEDENRKRVERNTKQPLIFGKGIAGITLDMTIGQAQKILSEPKSEEPDGTIDYREGLSIQWKRDEPRTPTQIGVDSAYTGEFVQLTKYFKGKGKKLGPEGVRIGTDFAEEFELDGGEGYELLRQVVRAAMEKDENFDCRAEGLCDIEEKGDVVRFTFPGGMILFSVDRKVVFLANLMPPFEMGKLENSIDLILGQVHDKESNTTIKLGEDWKTAYEKIGVKQKVTQTQSTAFVKRFGQIMAVITRSKYERSYKEPAGDEKLKALVGTLSYSHAIKLKDQYLQWEKAGDDIRMSFIDESKAAGQKNLIRLVVDGLRKDRKGQIRLMERLNEKILEKMQEQYGPVQISADQRVINPVYAKTSNDVIMNVVTAQGARVGSKVIAQRLNGIHNIIGKTPMIASTFFYDFDNKMGHVVTAEFDTSKASFGRFAATLMLQPFDYLVALSAVEPISAQDHTLMGLNLKKTKVEVTGVDEGRQEATIKVISEDSNGKTIEVVDHAIKFDAKSAIEIAPKGMSTKVVQVAEALMSSLPNVRLYLSDASANPKLVAVETSQFLGGITGLCGMKDFVPKQTLGAKTFMKQLKKAMEKRRKELEQEKKEFVCNVISEKDSDGTGQVKTVTFSDDRVKFIFMDTGSLRDYDSELTSVIFY